MSDAGPGIQYKFSQIGIEEVSSRINQLHEAFRNGQITYKQYRTDIREATAEGRAATQEFSQMKGAIAAANPTLLEYTRTMSLFGGVANTVLSITNAINLAQIASSGISSQLAQTQAEAASAYNEYIKDLNAYGPADSRTVAAYNKYINLNNQAAYETKQLAWQNISTTATIIASGFAIAGSIAQTYLGFKALALQSGALRTALMAIGDSSVLAAIGGVGLAIGLILLIFNAVYYGFRALSPAFATATDQIYNSILTHWHGNTLAADLLTPFETAFLGWSALMDQWQEGFYNFVNAIINAINVIPNSINKALGTSIPTLANWLPPAFQPGYVSNFEQAKAALGLNDLGATNLNPALPGANDTGSNLLPSAYGDMADTSKQQLDAQHVNNMMITGVLGQATTSTTLLNSMNGELANMSDLAKQQLAQTIANNQAAAASNARDSFLSEIENLKSQLYQYTGDNVTANYPEVVAYNSQVVDPHNAPIKAQIAALQAQADQQVQVYNQIRAAFPTLPSILSGGSPSSSPSYSFSGGGSTGVPYGQPGATVSGISGTNYGITGVTQTQLNAAAQSAYNYAVSKYGSNYFGNNNFTNPRGPDVSSLPYNPQVAGSGSGAAARQILYGGMFASGFSGVVASPTMMVVGEGGPEQVSITPLGGNKPAGSGPNITVIIQGSLLTDNTLVQKIRDVWKDDLRRGGF